MEWTTGSSDFTLKLLKIFRKGVWHELDLKRSHHNPQHYIPKSMVTVC